MFEEELKDLGLTENEIKVYLSLLKHGILTPSQLAENTGMHRSYIYDTVERLLEKGIVNSVLVNNKKSYQGVDPKILREIYEVKLKKIDEIMPQLEGIYNSRKEGTRVEMHKGKRVYKTLIKDLLANIKKNTEVCLLGVDEEKLEVVEPIYLKQYFTLLKEKNVKERIIVKKGSRMFGEKSLNYKTLGEEYFDETTIVVYPPKVYIFVLGEPYYLIVIENEKVANTYKKQFELLWNIAK